MFKELVQNERLLCAEPGGTRKLLAKEKIVSSKSTFLLGEGYQGSYQEDQLTSVGQEIPDD